MFVVPAYAHHAAEGIVDEDVYEMIDAMVADTPNADLNFEEMPSGGMETTITTQTVQSLENMLDDGLLTTISMLDGDVSVTIEFEDDRGAILIITQILP